MADNLHMTRRRLEAEMDVPEFIDWVAFYRIREARREQDRAKGKAPAKVSRAARSGVRGKHAGSR